MFSTLLIATLVVIAARAPATFSVPKPAAAPHELAMTRMDGNVKLGDTDARVSQLLGKLQTVKPESTQCCAMHLQLTLRGRSHHRNHR
jgi:hypothetical protein